MFSVRTLNSQEARIVAEAYLKARRNPNRVGEMLGLPDFDKNILSHPLVRREVIAIARSNAGTYSMEDHVAKLAEIRDLALEDKKYTAALGAEMSIGKARGLYDKIDAAANTDDPGVEPTKLTTEQIREMLASREKQQALPSPDNEEQLNSEPESINFFDEGDGFMEDGVP